MITKEESQFKSLQHTKRLKSVQQIIQILKNPQKRPNRPPKQPQLDRQQIRKTLKEKWKGSGYINSQFEKIPLLKAKMLDNWQIARINLSKRSYQSPKNYHGVRFDQHSRQFKDPSPNIYSQKFQAHLKKIQMDYEDHLFSQKLQKFQSINSKATAYKKSNQPSWFNQSKKLKTQGAYKFEVSKTFDKNSLMRSSKAQRVSSNRNTLDCTGLKFNCPVDKLFGFPSTININFTKRRVKTHLANNKYRTQQL